MIAALLPEVNGEPNLRAVTLPALITGKDCKISVPDMTAPENPNVSLDEPGPVRSVRYSDASPHHTVDVYYPFLHNTDRHAQPQFWVMSDVSMFSSLSPHLTSLLDTSTVAHGGIH